MAVGVMARAAAGVSVRAAARAATLARAAVRAAAKNKPIRLIGSWLLSQLSVA
jgi:hypothetical protein